MHISRSGETAWDDDEGPVDHGFTAEELEEIETKSTVHHHEHEDGEEPVEEDQVQAPEPEEEEHEVDAEEIENEHEHGQEEEQISPTAPEGEDLSEEDRLSRLADDEEDKTEHDPNAVHSPHSALGRAEGRGREWHEGVSHEGAPHEDGYLSDADLVRKTLGCLPMPI
jgi:ATP-dependent DNA ligase